jgi:hypothetical protein
MTNKELDEKRRRQEEQEESDRRRRQSDEDSRRMTNLALGDMLNTGIPGGFDMDITTPL